MASDPDAGGAVETRYAYREAAPDAAELFALSRERAERFEPLTVGCLTGFRVFYVNSDLAVGFDDLNMLNALRRAAPGRRHADYDITFHSPTRWTCRHRAEGFVLKVWGWQQE